MGKHTVEYDEIIGGCEAGITLAASHGKGANKRLTMVADYDKRTFTFLVEHHDDVVHECNWLQEAIDKYNEL